MALPLSSVETDLALLDVLLVLLPCSQPASFAWDPQQVFGNRVTNN